VNLRELVGQLVEVTADGDGKLQVRYRMDLDLPVVLVDAAGEAHEVSFVGADSGQAQLHVGLPAVLSHKVTGDPKPDRAASLEERVAALEALQRPTEG